MPAYAKRFDNNVVRKALEFVEQPEAEVAQARTWKIIKTDVEFHGVSPGCPGYRAIASGAEYRI